MRSYPHLFSPLRVGGVTFKNRILCAPMQLRYKTGDGFATDYEIGFFEARARGGAAQVTVGECAVDSRYQQQPVEFVLDDPKALPSLAEMAAAIKQHGALATIELNHGGRECNKNDLFGLKINRGGINPIGPMGYVRSDGIEVRRMDEALIEETAEKFAEAAWMVKLAGFDGCMLHGGHGWLLAQFLSARTNRRTDRFGGGLEGRARFPVMVIDRIRDKCGRDFLIELRLSGDELVEGGMRIDEVIEFTALVEDRVDLVHVSAGLHETFGTLGRMFPATYVPHGVNVYLAAAVKKHARVPVVTVGGISTPEMAEAIIASGRADFVAIGRALIADPDFPRKAKRGRAAVIRPCLRCTECLQQMGRSSHFACSVNPAAGREFRLGGVNPSAERQTVLVIGGGPAGTQAAITAAERGHAVTLLEKTDSLGGLLKYADSDPLKADLKAYKDYLIRLMNASGVEIRLNTEATPELVEREDADVVIAAIGSEPIVPGIPGIDRQNVMSVLEIYHKLDDIGRKVVLIGGGMVGCESALYLANRGREVLVLEMLDELAPGTFPPYSLPLLDQMAEQPNCSARTGMKCTEIIDGGVRAVDRDGREHLFEADTVLYCVGMQAKAGEVEKLRDAVRGEYVPVGDCVKAGRVGDAVRTGYFAALDVGG